MGFNRFWTTSLIGAAVGIAALCACSFIVDTEADQCKTTADCTKRGRGFEGLICSAGVCVAEGGCKTNAECIDANGGKPFICNKTTRACVNLQKDLGTGGVAAPCTPHVNPGDLRNDDTVWVGAVADTTSPLIGKFIGTPYVAWMELARQEIAAKTSGLPGATAGAKARPFALVHCEDNGDPVQSVAAANYLVKEAGIDIHISGLTNGTYIPMAQQVFLPNKVLAFNGLGAGSADIPSGNPATLYEMNTPLYFVDNAFLSSVGVMEQEVRARYSIPAGQDIRVALVSSKNPSFSLVADSVFSKIKFNNKDAVTNGANLKRFIYNEPATQAEYETTGADVAAYKPDLIVAIGLFELGDVVVPATETAIQKTPGARAPLWLATSYAVDPTLFGYMATNTDLQSRFVWPQSILDPPAAVLKSQALKSANPGLATYDLTLQGDSMLPYDVMYLIAYAIAANGANPVTGENVSKAIPKLFTKGGTIFHTGPEDLFNGFGSLAPGGAGMYLKGLQGFRGGEVVDGVESKESMDLDTAKGIMTYWPWRLYCPLSNELAGKALGLPDGTLPAPGLAATMAITGQPAGISFSYPDYKTATGAVSPYCKFYAKQAPVGDGGADGG